MTRLPPSVPEVAALRPVPARARGLWQRQDGRARPAAGRAGRRDHGHGDRRPLRRRVRRRDREFAGGRDPRARRGLPRADRVSRGQPRHQGRRAVPDGPQAVRGGAGGGAGGAAGAAGAARHGKRQPEARRAARGRGRAQPEGPRRRAGFARCGGRGGRRRPVPRAAGRDQPELHDHPLARHRRDELRAQAARQLHRARSRQPAHLRLGARPDARQLQRLGERAAASSTSW